MQRRAFLATGSATAIAALAGCLAPSFTDAEYDIGMQSNGFVPDNPIAFSPATYGASVGETVVWANTGSRNHTVTAYESGIPENAEYFASGGFNSEEAAREAWTNSLGGAGIISPGEKYEHTFDVPGEYYYFCIPHEPAGMIGKILVKEKFSE